jgi:hypothetical protein
MNYIRNNNNLFEYKFYNLTYYETQFLVLT